MVLCYGAVKMEWLPQDVLLWFLAATGGLMFLPPIISAVKEAVKDLRRPAEESQPIQKQLEVISTTLAEIRKDYERAWNKVIGSPGSGSEEFDVRGIPEDYYVLPKKLYNNLSSEFETKIRKIVNDCKETIWARRSVLHFAIVQSRQGAAAERVATARR